MFVTVDLKTVIRVNKILQTITSEFITELETAVMCVLHNAVVKVQVIEIYSIFSFFQLPFSPY
jgi:hypothetical protein